MEIDYFDRIIAKDVIEINVKAKVAHFLEKDKQRQKEERKQNEGNLSLDQLLSNGFQPTNTTSLEQEIIIRHREEKYLQSPEYKQFRKALRQEIRKVFDLMSEQEKKVMYLRFFKDYSISQIANALGIARGTAQGYIARGCKHIKFFLDRDIKEQDKIERKKKMKREQKKYTDL